MELSLDQFLAMRNAGKMMLVAVGSEQGYISRSRYPLGRYCGIVKRGLRFGMHKYQPCGYGPYGSTRYCVNLYFYEV